MEQVLIIADKSRHVEKTAAYLYLRSPDLMYTIHLTLATDMHLYMCIISMYCTIERVIGHKGES